MEKIVIFGISQLASLAHFYFENDSPHEVVAFTVDKNYMEVDEFRGLPVIAFEDIEKKFPPSEYRMFLPISFKQMNYFRKAKFDEAKRKGYQCISYVSSKATTWPDLSIGENCFIFEDNTIQPFVKIGNNITLWSGNHIGHHSVIEDHNFISSHVVVSGHCHILSNCFIGVNSTLGHQVTVGKESLIGAGAIITKNTEEKSVYVPAKSVKLDKTSDMFNL